MQNLKSVIYMINDTKIVYTVDDIRKLLGIGRKQAYELANSGQFPIKRIGTKIVISKEIFLKWLNSNDKE